MYVSYYRCESCGEVRQCGATHLKHRPENERPLLRCDAKCSGVHTPHKLVTNEYLFADRNTGATKLSDLIFRRCVALRGEPAVATV